MRPHNTESDHFSPEDRVRLWYTVSDLLPDDGDQHAELSGSGLYQLEEILKRKFGRFSLGDGGDAHERIKAFIAAAPEEELLDLVEVVPQARLLAHGECCQRPYSLARPNPVRVLNEAQSKLNARLESTSSSARFDNQGLLVRNPLAPTVPIPLSRLPGQENFRIDLHARCADDYPTALIFVDLDHFKQVNDKLGHQAGDACLVHVAEVIGKIVAMRAKVYRYGGDEFVVLVPNCTTAEAEPTAERIRREIEEANVAGEVKVTVSIGVAGTDHVSKDTEDLIKRADQMVYQSKNGGKNRVSVCKA